jgi:hypothetical protein
MSAEEFSRAKSGMVHRLRQNGNAPMLPSNISDKDERALLRSIVEYSDTTIDSAWVDRSSGLVVRQVFINKEGQTAVRYTYTQVTPGTFVRAGSVYEFGVGNKRQSVRQSLSNVSVQFKER